MLKELQEDKVFSDDLAIASSSWLTCAIGENWENLKKKGYEFKDPRYRGRITAGATRKEIR